MHPDGKTDISTQLNQAKISAILYYNSEAYIDLAACLEFLNLHPDGITDISTPQKKYAEMGRLYLRGFKSKFINPQITDETNYNLGARIISKQITTDPETNLLITDRASIAAKYWHRSNLPLAKEYLVRMILSEKLTEHPDGSGHIQNPDLAGYEVLSAINSTDIQRNTCLWMLIAKGTKDIYKESKLNTPAEKFIAIQQDFNARSKEDREHPRTQFALGIAYSGLGFYAQAQPYLQFALDNGYDTVAYLDLCTTELEWAALEATSSDDELEATKEGGVNVIQDPKRTEEQEHLQSADAERECQQKTEETARLVALKKEARAEKAQKKEELKKQRAEARVIVHSAPPSFKIPVTRVDLSPEAQVQKDTMEKILPGKADAIIQELMDTGCPRQLKSLGRNSKMGKKLSTGNQLLTEVKMNDFHRLFYTRNDDGIVTIHQIGDHT